MDQSTAGLPEGLHYETGLLTSELEMDIAARIAELPLKPFEFRGYLGNRRVVSFGFRYDYTRRAVEASASLPAFLDPVRERAAAFAGRPAEAFVQVLVTEYAPGASIGWHRDKPEFGDVVGVSLLAPCRLRFRRKAAAGWERAALTVAPRSAYLLSGPARHEWQHSIPAVEALRYSITFRTRSTRPP